MIVSGILLSSAILIFLLGAEVSLFFGLRRLADLREIPPLGGPSLPRVSVIVAARNEERHLEEALGSLLGLDYPELEIIVVDDRSTDQTPAILERARGKSPAPRMIRVDELPGGWLGKCHALSRGAAAATGEYLLFSDADIVFERTILRRTMEYVRREGLDHLSVIPGLRMPGVLLKSIGATFGIFFMLYSRPWKAPDPKSRAHIGIGAFNLVRREFYEKVGGHESVRLCPVDDVKLGERLKGAGARQAAAVGVGFLSVEWYSSLGELVRGLEKNSFAAVGYRLWVVALSSLVILGLSAGPLLLPFLAPSGLVWAESGVSVFLLSALYVDQARLQKIPVASLILFPLTLGIMIFIWWRSALRTLARGGIEWRGTTYSLKELKNS